MTTRDADMESIPEDRKFQVEYSEFCADPLTHLKLLAEFAGIEPTPEQYAKAVSQVDGTLDHHKETVPA